MSRIIAAAVGCGLMLSAGADLHGQTRVVPGEHRTTAATVEAIDLSTRLVTVRTNKGELQTIHVPDGATRFADLRIGDKVTATYYDNIIIRLKPAGEADVDTRDSSVITPRSGGLGGTNATQQTITATIDAIDLAVPSITFKGPGGWGYSSKVQDKAALQQVKVGDRVDITWTAATLVSVVRETAAN